MTPVAHRTVNLEHMIRRLRRELVASDETLSNQRAMYPNPWQSINDGWCGTFAEMLCDRARRRKVYLVLQLDSGDLERGGVHGEHLWVYLDGLHYDAECPRGVADWRFLPFFRRKAMKRKRPTRRRSSMLHERSDLDRCAEAVDRAWRHFKAYCKKQSFKKELPTNG